MKKSILALGAFALLSGCITRGIAPDEVPQLAPDQGLIGIRFDSLDKISQIQYTPDSGAALYIGSVEPGITTHVFAAKAGKYCIYQFHFGDWKITWDERNLCFEVKAGELVYGGLWAPRVVRGRVNMQQTFGDEDYFEKAVRRQYPGVAGAYLKPE